LTLTQQVQTDGTSNVGGFFGANRIQALNLMVLLPDLLAQS
jgi:hypothetical protein